MADGKIFLKCRHPTVMLKIMDNNRQRLVWLFIIGLGILLFRFLWTWAKTVGI